MKKTILYILLLFIGLSIIACVNNNDVHLESSATKKDYPEGFTSADLQFAEIRKNSPIKEGEKVDTIRPEVARFVKNQFYENNLKEDILEDLTYYYNKNARSSKLNNIILHSFDNVGYDYSINLKQIDYINNDEFKRKILEDKSNFNELNIKNIGDVMVKNLKSPLSSEIHMLFNKNKKSYYIIFKSEYISIPEMVMIIESFSKLLK